MQLVRLRLPFSVSFLEVHKTIAENPQLCFQRNLYFSVLMSLQAARLAMITARSHVVHHAHACT